MLVDIEHRLCHGHVDKLADTGVFALIERRQNCGRRLHARVHVGMAVGILGVVATAGVALRCDDPRLGFDDRSEGTPVNPWPGLAVPRQRRVDQPRVARPDHLGVEAKSFHHPGPIVLD